MTVFLRVLRTLGLLGPIVFFLWRFFQRRDVFYQAFVIEPDSRDRILHVFVPKYSTVVAHHITYRFDVPRNAPPPAMPRHVKVVGLADDGSLETLVVEIDGTTVRPDGGTYHITLSMEPHRKARESNRVIAEHGWLACENINVTVQCETLLSN